MKYNEFFAKFSTPGLKHIIKSLYLVKLGEEQLLYKEVDSQFSFFIVLFGKIILHTKDLGAIGLVKMGDFIGQDILFDYKSKARTESAYSEGDTYLLECEFGEWKKLRDVLTLMGLKKDFLTMDNHMKKCYQQIKTWRTHKKRVIGI